MAPRLNIIVGSTRPGRVGTKVAAWIEAFAKKHGAFDVRLVDIADFDLPVYNEPKHPRLQDYEHGHTKAWSESVASADAYVFVIPEYNHFAPPALVNALDFVYKEWNYKPAGLVSYGGLSGGMRSAQSLKPLLSTLKVVPLPEAVAIPFVANAVQDGTFHPNEMMEQGATAMLDELARWAEALKPLSA